MKAIVTLGVVLGLAGVVTLAAAQSAVVGTPGGNPAKRSCAFSSEAPPQVPPTVGMTAPATPPPSTPTMSAPPGTSPLAANEIVGPTSTSYMLASGNYYPDQVDTPNVTRQAKPGSVFISTSSPTNVGVQC